jgi:hypothetical protein
MSNPSVTATITADDQASPKLRELLTLSQKLAATAKSIFNEGGAGQFSRKRASNDTRKNPQSALRYWRNRCGRGGGQGASNR